MGDEPRLVRQRDLAWRRRSAGKLIAERFRWELKNARDGWQIKARKKKRQPLPDWYLAEPPVPEDCEFFFTAYGDLMSCRPPGPGGMIPWTAVHQYGVHKRLDRDVIDLLWMIVGKMDAIERQWLAERKPRASNPQ